MAYDQPGRFRMRTNRTEKTNVAADPCLGKIESSWNEAKRAGDWCFCAEVLRFWVKHLVVDNVVPAEFNSEIKKRIAFLEKKLDSIEFSEAKKLIDAISYARKRINTAADTPARGGKFKTDISATDRERVSRTLDTGFLTSLKRPIVAFTDPDSDSDEPGSNGNDIG